MLADLIRLYEENLEKVRGVEARAGIEENLAAAKAMRLGLRANVQDQ